MHARSGWGCVASPARGNADRNPSRKTRTCAIACCVFAWLLVPQSLFAQVADVTLTDLTTHAASVIWRSSEPVITASLRVFSDPDGATEITQSLSVVLDSAAFPPALDRGVVRVTVSGLVPDSVVFFQTETTGASGTVVFPSTPPLLQIPTRVEVNRISDAGAPITNDVIRFNVFAPDGVTPAAGTLLLVRAPGLAALGVSTFVGEGFAPPTASVNVNNLFGSATRSTANIEANSVLELTEFRGLLCAPEDHKLVRFRRAPAHDETPVITQLEDPDACFFADLLCDDVVDIRDVQRGLNVFGVMAGECAFNSDIDVVPDAVIDIRDVQSVLNRFGQRGPFPP